MAGAGLAPLRSSSLPPGPGEANCGPDSPPGQTAVAGRCSGPGLSIVSGDVADSRWPVATRCRGTERQRVAQGGHLLCTQPAGPAACHGRGGSTALSPPLFRGWGSLRNLEGPHSRRGGSCGAHASATTVTALSPHHADCPRQPRDYGRDDGTPLSSPLLPLGGGWMLIPAACGDRGRPVTDGECEKGE